MRDVLYAILVPILLIGGYVLFTQFPVAFGTTVTTINGSDTLSASRTVINTNFANLNSGKIEVGSTSIAAITTLANLTTIGTLSSIAISGLGTFGSATSTTLGTSRLYANTASIGQTASTTVTPTGFIGIATSTPWGMLSISPSAIGAAPAFVIGSTTKQAALQTTNGRYTTTCLTVYQATGEQATSTNMTIDWPNTCNEIDIKIGTLAATINVINATTSNLAGGRKLVNVLNAQGTASTITWTGVDWYGGTAPTQTTTGNHGDSYSLHVSSGTSTIAAPTYKVFGAQSADLQ